MAGRIGIRRSVDYKRTGESETRKQPNATKQDVCHEQ